MNLRENIDFHNHYKKYFLVLDELKKSFKYCSYLSEIGFKYHKNKLNITKIGNIYCFYLQNQNSVSSYRVHLNEDTHYLNSDTGIFFK